MSNKNEFKELTEKEKEYDDLFEEFLNSGEEKTFSKIEVEKIIEAHLFKEVIGKFSHDVMRKKSKNLLVTTKEFGSKIFNVKSLFDFSLFYLFYIGFLLIIDKVVYPNLFMDRSSVFIIGLGFTLVDKFIKPFIFIADLISFTFHKVGLILLVIYVIIFMIISYYYAESITIEQAIVISLILLLAISVIDFLRKDSFFKTNYMEDGSDESESDADE